MKVTKVGTVTHTADGRTQIAGFEYDAEGGPVDLGEMLRLAQGHGANHGRYCGCDKLK